MNINFLISNVTVIGVHPVTLNDDIVVDVRAGQANLHITDPYSLGRVIIIPMIDESILEEEYVMLELSVVNPIDKYALRAGDTKVVAVSPDLLSKFTVQYDIITK